MNEHQTDGRRTRKPGHAHGHGGGHSHRHTQTANQKRLAWTLALVVTYLLAEVVGGILSGSLALLADAGHMFSDATALIISLAAIWIAKRPPTSTNTYGYHRTEIIAALINGAALLAVAVLIVREAVERLGQPQEIEARLVLGVAAGGLLVNLIGLAVLAGGTHASLNIRGAWLHVLSDALGSVAVILAAAFAWAFGWHWADPVVSIAVAVLVIVSSWSLLRESLAVLMEAVPGHIELDDVRDAIRAVDGVLGMDRLHVWTISSGVIALSAHVCVSGDGRFGQVLAEIRQTLLDRFEIEHITIQLEPEGAPVECCAHRRHEAASQAARGSSATGKMQLSQA